MLVACLVMKTRWLQELVLRHSLAAASPFEEDFSATMMPYLKLPELYPARMLWKARRKASASPPTFTQQSTVHYSAVALDEEGGTLREGQLPQGGVENQLSTDIPKSNVRDE